MKKFWIVSLAIAITLGLLAMVVPTGQGENFLTYIVLPIVVIMLARSPTPKSGDWSMIVAILLGLLNVVLPLLIELNTQMVVNAVVCISFASITAGLAKKRGQPPIKWWCLALILPLFAWIVLFTSRNGLPQGGGKRRTSPSMRKLEAIGNTPDGDLCLSLFPCGFFWRTFGQGKFWADIMTFPPRYGLVICRPEHLLDPICTVYFANRKLAETMYHRIAQALIQDGVYGKLFPKIIHDAGSDGIDARWVPNLKPIAESEIEEITDLEEKEFSDRLAKYVKQQSEKP